MTSDNPILFSTPPSTTHTFKKELGEKGDVRRTGTERFGLWLSLQLVCYSRHKRYNKCRLVGTHQSEEHKRKTALALMGNKYRLGSKPSDETHRKISDSIKIFHMKLRQKQLIT
jgi:hypothetical protein